MNRTAPRTAPLLPCEQHLGVDMGDEIQRLIESATNQPCPCRRGAVCPMLDDQDQFPLIPRLQAKDVRAP